MADVASRKGDIGGTEIRLAAWLEPEERYQRRYRPIQPLVERASAGDVLFNADPSIRTWIIRDWSLGEGEEVWVPGAYNQAKGVRPVDPGKGLELTRLLVDETPSGIETIKRFGYGQGTLWLAAEEATSGDLEVWPWDIDSEAFGAEVTILSATGEDPTSIADGATAGSDTMFIAVTNNKIYSFNGAVTTHYDTGTGDDFTNDPIISSWGGKLYALDGDDLYEVDQTTTDTRTLLVDLTGVSDDYSGTGAGTPRQAYFRLSGSDKGPIWIQRLNSGETYIWEYNVASDTEERIGRLPVDYAYPYDIYFANGFYFVTFLYAPRDSDVGEAYMFAFRGGQQSVIGPFRTDDDTLQSVPIRIGGVVGDDLVIGYSEGIWGYNLTTGGLVQIGVVSGAAGRPQEIITLGQEIFAHDYSNSVERYDPTTYDTSASLTLRTGRHDFEYPGLRKRLLDVTVVTDPLPASTDVTMAVAVDNGSFTALTGTHDTDNQVRFTWAASTSSTDFVGYEFELQVTLNSDNSANTPTIRQINATAASAAYRREWVLGVDVSDLSHEEIDNLNALVDGGVVTFTDPWQNRESDADDTFNVIVEEISTPEIRSPQTPNELVAFMRLRDRDLVSGTGGSA